MNYCKTELHVWTVQLNTLTADDPGLLEQQIYDDGNCDTSLNYFNKFILIKASDYLASIDTGNWHNNYKEVQAELADSCRACATFPAVVATTLKLIKY